MALEAVYNDSILTNRTKPLLGQLLIKDELISEEQLEIALRKQKDSGKLLGETLVGLSFLNEESDLLPVLAGQFGVEHIKIKGIIM